MDVRSAKCDRIICLGDIVGYGPNPVEVLESVHSTADYILLGNHDAAVCGLLDPELFNDHAAFMINWTRERLNKNAIKFLQKLPLSISSEFFRCAHGSLNDPAAFNYVFQADDARASWNSITDDLAFIGHTHEPRIFVLGSSDTPRSVEMQDFVLEDKKRFIVNVGSVGQPRDRTVLANYCIFDSEKKSVFQRKIPFDLDAYMKAVSNAEIPEESTFFVKDDPRKTYEPIRAHINFSPPTDPRKHASSAVKNMNAGNLSQNASRWKTASIAALSALMLSSAIFFLVDWQNKTKTEVIRAENRKAIDAKNVPYGINLLPPLFDSSDNPKNIVSSWDRLIGNRDKQKIIVLFENDVSCLHLVSTSKEEIQLISPELLCAPLQKFTVSALFKKSKGFEGKTALVVSLERKKDELLDTIDQYLVKEPLQERKDGWLITKQTFQLPAGSHRMKVSIRASFLGEVEIKDVVLTLKK